MKKVCAKYGVLLILDEVMCGMGRTGYLHAWQEENVAPDILILGKGLAGNYQAFLLYSLTIPLPTPSSMA
jgi:adenosylmethionine-8-amino-7-oxononanoate aminotransferase